MVREAKRTSPPNDKVPILGRSRSAEAPSSHGEVNGTLPSVDSGGGGPVKAVLADGKTSVPRLSVLSMAGPAPVSWPDQRAPSSEPDMTVEAATQLVLEGAMKWAYQLEA